MDQVHTGYDDALVRLQRILLLRDLGLARIRRVLDHGTDEEAALRRHRAWLGAEHATFVGDTLREYAARHL